MFSDLTYYLLLLIAVLAYRFATRKYKPTILSLTGIVFYAYYAGQWVVLLVTLSVAFWTLLYFQPKNESPLSSKVKWGSSLVIIGSVCVLGFFKYAPFFASIFGERYVNPLGIPLAISFFSFEFIHVAAERARGRFPEIAFRDWLAFIFFFPTMIAGPIKRYDQFGPSLDAPPADANDVLEGLFRILLGLVKKSLIADNLFTLISEVGSPEKTHSVPFLTLAVILYGFRILLDFAGYSDIAIGSARLFGIRVPENFLFPYRQQNITMFWRHWHISLSSWLTDYIYIPLGGSRKGFVRSLVNVLLVMLISGLWHGAAWNFVLWGGWHGILLVVHKVWRTLALPKVPEGLANGFMFKAASYIITMLAVWFGWLLFMWPLADVARYFELLLK